MVKQALSIPSALLTGPYSRFAWVFTAGFLITFALGWSFAYFFVAFFAALFARVFSWTEVYLMPLLATIIIVVFLEFVALGAGKIDELAVDLVKDKAWLIRTASASYLGLVFSVAAALYIRVFIRRFR